MHILRLSLRDFRKFSHLDIEFTPGLNVVKGPNEAGKTTLQRAISLSLLDRPTGKKAENDYKAWASERLYRLEIDCQMPDGQQVHVVKDYDTKSHEVSSAHGTDTSRQALEEFAQEALGTQSMKMFESSACIDQDAMSNLDIGKAEISQQLQAILTGGEDVGLDEAIAKLEKKISELEKGWRTLAPVNPGPIENLLRRIREVDGELTHTREEASRIETARERLAEIRRRLLELQGELETNKKALQVYGERVAAKDSLGNLTRAEEELEENLTRLSEAVQQKQGALTALADFGSLQALGDQDLKTFRELRQSLLVTEGKERDRSSDVIALEKHIAETKRSKQRQWLAPTIMAVVGAGIAFPSALLFLVGNQPWMDYIGAAAFFIGVLLAMVAGLWLAIRLFIKPEDLLSRFAQAKQLQEDASREVECLRAQLVELMQTVGCQTWEQFEGRLAEIDKLTRKVNEVSAYIDGILRGGETIEILELQRKDTSRARRDVGEKLEEFGSVPDLSLVEYEGLKAGTEKLQEEQSCIEAERLELQGILKGARSGMEDVLRFEEEKSALEDEVGHLQSWHDVYALTSEVMQEARTGTMRTARDVLAPRMATYLNRLTLGRYSEVHIDESLEPVLIHPSKEAGPIEIGEMSQGTLDQLYLAARFALCDVLFGDAHPPFLMDDPFLKFDSQRRTAALSLCHDLSRDRQIILFTCHDGYEEYADRVINLADF
jgi:uncharacterized protein YhaN